MSNDSIEPISDEDRAFTIPLAEAGKLANSEIIIALDARLSAAEAKADKWATEAASLGTKLFAAEARAAEAEEIAADRAGRVLELMSLCGQADRYRSALRESHKAMDWLFAKIIGLDPTFFPSKSPAWPAMVEAHELTKDAACAALDGETGQQGEKP